MSRKSSLSFGLIVSVLTATALSIGTTLMTYAQETTIQPAYSQENVTGTQNTTGITSNEEEDDKNDVEEGPGEDADEPGDIDGPNDKED
jgi:hypothetical protein